MSIVNAFSRMVLGSHTKLEFSQFRFRRRIVSPPAWIPPMHHPVRANLYKDDRKFVDQSSWSDPAWRHLQENEPLQFDGKHGYFPFHLIPGIANPPDCRQNAYNADTSKRIGMVGRKIGMTLQWMKDGTRCLCTMIHFPDNVVLSANDPETWYRQSPTGKRKAFGKLGPSWSQMVGAFDDESVFYTKPYRQIFNRVGVPCKKHIGGFVVSEDAVVQPGTRLDVRHFQVGQFVNVSGKTIDWGFQGVVHRWGMRGLPSRRTTKAHRRIGSIGAKGEAKVWPGRKLPGHMGYEWRLQPGLLVLRINPIEQVIYVRGCVPGDIDDEMLLVNDCMMEDKRAQIPTPSFPTFYPGNCPNEQEDREKRHQIYNCTSRDLYHPNLFQFTQPSVLYTEADETKSKVRDKTRAKTAKVKKN